jgi:hypothetical protein
MVLIVSIAPRLSRFGTLPAETDLLIACSVLTQVRLIPPAIFLAQFPRAVYQRLYFFAQFRPATDSEIVGECSALLQRFPDSTTAPLAV